MLISYLEQGHHNADIVILIIVMQSRSAIKLIPLYVLFVPSDTLKTLAIAISGYEFLLMLTYSFNFSSRNSHSDFELVVFSAFR